MNSQLVDISSQFLFAFLMLICQSCGFNYSLYYTFSVIRSRISGWGMFVKSDITSKLIRKSDSGKQLVSARRKLCQSTCNFDRMCCFMSSRNLSNQYSVCSILHMTLPVKQTSNYTEIRSCWCVWIKD